MKIICTDNFARESIADRLVVEGIEHEGEAIAMSNGLNQAFGGENSPNYYTAVPDNYRLWRGMEELV